MSEEMKNGRVRQVSDKIADAGADAVAELGVEAVRQVANVFRNKLQNFIEKVTTQANEETKQLIQQDALALLQEEIDAHSRMEKIGEEKKEIAFIFAMKKLGYSEEQMDLLLTTAGRSYKPKDKSINDANTAVD